jgi:G-patch domain
LGTRDQINSGPQTAGLTFRKRVKLANNESGDDLDSKSKPGSGDHSEAPEEELTEDQKAIKALISSAEGGEVKEEEVAAIPIPSSSGMSTPMSLAEREKAAYQHDILELPEPASLEAYERIPVSQFGAALLRGMGWKEGEAASRTRKGPVEPWIPTQRPQLLGIGAKEREVLDDGSGKKSTKNKQESKKYIPLVKKDKVLSPFGQCL